jgi:hypothetical protein
MCSVFGVLRNASESLIENRDQLAWPGVGGRKQFILTYHRSSHLDEDYVHAYDSSNEQDGADLENVMFQTSDLAKKRTSVLTAARAGRALEPERIALGGVRAG